MGTFDNLEEQSANQNLQSATEIIDNELLNVERIATDYSFWDDTYLFSQNNDTDYIASNYHPDSLKSLNINFVLIFNESGHLLYGSSIDSETGDGTPVDIATASSIYNSFMKNSSPEQTHSGICSADSDYMFMAATPILKSDRTGPSAGTFIMGRQINPVEIKHIENMVRLPVTLYEIDGLTQPDDVLTAKTMLNYQTRTLVKPVNDSIIGGYELLYDIDGKPVMVIRVDTPRDIRKEGLESMVYFMIIISTIIFVYSLILLFVTDSFFVRKLEKINKRLGEIRVSKNLSQRILVEGNDELATLSQNANLMLESLQASHDSLELSEKKYRSLFKNMLNMFAYFQVIKDEQGKPTDVTLIEANESFITATGIDMYNAAGKRIMEEFPEISKGDRQTFKSILYEIINDPSAKGEMFIQSMNMWCNYSVYKLSDEHFAIILLDITEQKQAEKQLRAAKDDLELRVQERTRELNVSNEALKVDIIQRTKVEEKLLKSLEEKEVMLKEIHHRVKNNMQVISSILSLQLPGLKDDKDREVFIECQDRIRSMALVHEKLYQSKEFSNIDVNDYLKSLIAYLFSSYAFKNDKVSLRMEVEKVSWDIDMAIACGLLLNELITNSLKHAFPDNRAGEIFIILKQENDTEVKMVVGDNGVGIPGSMDVNKVTTLGLRLIRLMAMQLEAKMEIDVTNGTCYTFTFASQE